MEHICVGMVAHVDSGKTTLSEGILCKTGVIRSVGRVDHGNTFLDTYGLERQRGITIFSKQAEFSLKEKTYTLLDTPGHVDFSAEMERTLPVLDYAVLVINGGDGIQSHTMTLWKLLDRYAIPTFVFINKMDQQGTDREKLICELQKGLSDGCLDMKNADSEDIAMFDESLMDKYLNGGSVNDDDIITLIRERKLFPCYFGSALKDEGVDEFLAEFEKFTVKGCYGEKFGAKVFKITRDSQGNRLTHLKITGGSLKVKDFVSGYTESSEGEEKAWEEKVDRICIFSGDKFSTKNEVFSGEICAVTGLTKTRAGEGLGADKSSKKPYLEPVLSYKIILPEGIDVHGMLMKLKQLEEEEPHLGIRWNESLSEIHARVMGEIEIEILKNLIKERFSIDVEFGQGSIVYKESILKPVEGVGHYEPLKHYAEVHLFMEPLETGSGLVFATDCSEDKLNKNWQRLILTHLKEKSHKGVLTGSEITDMKITLVAGRAHLKHTEGGDFRQATYRAVRQGLKKAENVLLEPVYEFRLEIPQSFVGRALNDIQRMHGKSQLPDMEGDMSIITGTAPVSEMNGYHGEVISYTAGKGRLFCSIKGYEPCHDPEKIIENIGYDSETDLDNPTGSIFCAHGAGFYVSWNEVEEYMHLDSKDEVGEEIFGEESFATNASKEVYDDRELEKIFERTYGPIDRNKDFNNLREYDRLEKERQRLREINEAEAEAIKERYRQKNLMKKPEREKYLLVDGYNIIFAWPELKSLSNTNLDAARGKLMDILCNYQGYKGMTLILVFDAYKIKGNQGEVRKYNNIYVIYTKEAETADQYIEKAVHAIGKKHDVTVATSDALEQMIIWGEGAKRLSANDLKYEINMANDEIKMKSSSIF